MKLTLHHINITGTDVPAMDRFYDEVLCQDTIPEMATLPTLDEDSIRVPVAFRTDGQTQFHLAQQDLGLAMHHKKAINPLERGHIAYRCDDIEAVKRELEEKGVAYSDWGDRAVEGWHQIFFYDPDGNVIEVHQIVETE